MNNYDPFLNILPSVDLHGLNRDMVKCILDDFICDNIKMNNKKIIVIHGKGEGILKKETHLLLKNDKRVKRYYIDNFNDGETIIELN